MRHIVDYETIARTLNYWRTAEEVRAIWYPIITIRNENDVQRALAERRPFTVVYDTESAP